MDSKDTDRYKGVLYSVNGDIIIIDTLLSG